MFSIDKDGRIKVDGRYRGTVNSPGKVHPEGAELIAAWKEMKELTDEVAPDLFQVAAGDEWEEVSAQIRFLVPDGSWKTANALDEDLRKLLRDLVAYCDLVGIDTESVQLEAEAPIDGPGDLSWDFYVLAIEGSSVQALRPVLERLTAAVRATRIEEFALKADSRSAI